MFTPSPVRVGTLLSEAPGTPIGASFFEFELKPTGNDSADQTQHECKKMAVCTHECKKIAKCTHDIFKTELLGVLLQEEDIVNWRRAVWRTGLHRSGFWA